MGFATPKKKGGGGKRGEFIKKNEISAGSGKVACMEGNPVLDLYELGCGAPCILIAGEKKKWSWGG